MFPLNITRIDANCAELFLPFYSAKKKKGKKKCDVEENKILGGQTLARSILFNGVFLACVYKTINIAPGFIYDFSFFFLFLSLGRGFTYVCINHWSLEGVEGALLSSTAISARRKIAHHFSCFFFYPPLLLEGGFVLT